MPNVLIAACVTQGVALGYGQQLGLQPAPTRLLVYFVIFAFEIFGCARHSPNKFLKVRLLAMAKFE